MVCDVTGRDATVASAWSILLIVREDLAACFIEACRRPAARSPLPGLTLCPLPSALCPRCPSPAACRPPATAAGGHCRRPDRHRRARRRPVGWWRALRPADRAPGPARQRSHHARQAAGGCGHRGPALGGRRGRVADAGPARLGGRQRQRPPLGGPPAGSRSRRLVRGHPAPERRVQPRGARRRPPAHAAGGPPPDATRPGARRGARGRRRGRRHGGQRGANANDQVPGPWPRAPGPDSPAPIASRLPLPASHTRVPHHARRREGRFASPRGGLLCNPDGASPVCASRGSRSARCGTAQSTGTTGRVRAPAGRAPAGRATRSASRGGTESGRTGRITSRRSNQPHRKHPRPETPFRRASRQAGGVPPSTG